MGTNVDARAARSAWLVATALVALLVLRGVVWLVVSGVQAANGDLRLTMDTVMSFEPSASLPAGWVVTGDLPVRVTMANPPLSQFLLLVGTHAPGFLLLVAGLWLIQRVAASIRRGDPFQEANARRLRWVGILLLLGYPLSVFVGGFFQNWFFSNEHSPALPPAEITIGFPVISLAAILGGFCFLVLAEVFRYGVRLREDVEATV